MGMTIGIVIERRRSPGAPWERSRLSDVKPAASARPESAAGTVQAVR